MKISKNFLGKIKFQNFIHAKFYTSYFLFLGDFFISQKLAHTE